MSCSSAACEAPARTRPGGPGRATTVSGTRVPLLLPFSFTFRRLSLLFLCLCLCLFLSYLLLHASTLSLSLLLFLLLFLPLFLPLLREATTLATYQPTASTAGMVIVCWTRQPPSLRSPMHRLQRAGGAAPQGAAPQACSVHQTCGRLVDASAPPASAPGRAPHRRGRRRLAPQDGRAGSP